jgi:hypothetical protein
MEILSRSELLIKDIQDHLNAGPSRDSTIQVLDVMDKIRAAIDRLLDFIRAAIRKGSTTTA